jgi:hypothetical protein
MNNPAPSGLRGFTLVEITLTMMLGMAIGSITLALFNQQLAFLQVYQAQNFLTYEAPVISTHVSKLVGKSERFRLHNTVDEALANTNPQAVSAPVLVLNFRQPDGVMRAAILSFEDRGIGPALYYYLVPLSGTIGSPQWYVTKAPTNVSFAVVEGILRMTLTGANGEVITYSGAMTQ